MVTALALVGAASLRETRVASPPETASRDVVLQFYDAVNAALRTGDPAAIDVVVAPDFVEREPVPGTPPDRAGLGRYLTSLHAAYPGLQLTVEALTADGDLAMARVATHGGERGAFLGIPLTSRLPLWGRVERFRIAEGWIVERWADADALSLLQPLQQAQVEGRSPQRQIVSLARFTVAPGEGGRLPGLFIGHRLLVVEAGARPFRSTPRPRRRPCSHRRRPSGRRARRNQFGRAPSGRWRQEIFSSCPPGLRERPTPMSRCRP
jgi:predicted ester cyclase